jgi:hypothetical protein
VVAIDGTAQIKVWDARRATDDKTGLRGFVVATKRAAEGDGW